MAPQPLLSSLSTAGGFVAVLGGMCTLAGMGHGCASGSDSADVSGSDDIYYLDADRDRLSNWDEDHLYSTDKYDPDTDDDGWLDGEEVLDYGTSPTNPENHP